MRYKRFVTRYYFDGSWWDVPIYAKDWAEAEARCQKLGLQLDGTHVLTLPGFLGWPVTKAMDLWQWLKGILSYWR